MSLPSESILNADDEFFFLAIAHRLNTIQDADCIYVLKDGVVTEKGKHNELLAMGGIYFE